MAGGWGVYWVDLIVFTDTKQLVKAFIFQKRRQSSGLMLLFIVFTGT